MVFLVLWVNGKRMKLYAWDISVNHLVTYFPAQLTVSKLSQNTKFWVVIRPHLCPLCPRWRWGCAWPMRGDYSLYWPIRGLYWPIRGHSPDHQPPLVTAPPPILCPPILARPSAQAGQTQAPPKPISWQITNKSYKLALVVSVKLKWIRRSFFGSNRLSGNADVFQSVCFLGQKLSEAPNFHFSG